MYPIEIFFIENKLYVEVFTEGSKNNKNYEYAFYLYRNDSRVEIKWYENSNSVLFDLNNISGFYFVKIFIRKSKDSDLIIFDSQKLHYQDSVYNLKNWNYPSIESDIYNFTSDCISNSTDGIYRLKYDRESLDFLCEGTERFIKERGVLVCLSGAITKREQKKAPFFSGLNIAHKLEMPIISISDPSLAISNNISLGWYAGNEAQKKLPQTIASILSLISKKLDTKIIFFGGSGGGFASLSIMHYMTGEAYGLIWNPQTSISKYYKNYVANYIREAFPKTIVHSNLYMTLEKIGIIHDLNKLYGENKNKEVKILYLQNSTDTFHVKQHMYPLINATNASKENNYVYASSVGIVFCMKNWGEGHISPDTDKIIEILSKIIADNDILEIALNLD